MYKAMESCLCVEYNRSYEVVVLPVLLGLFIALPPGSERVAGHAKRTRYHVGIQVRHVNSTIVLGHGQHLNGAARLACGLLPRVLAWHCRPPCSENQTAPNQVG